MSKMQRTALDYIETRRGIIADQLNKAEKATSCEMVKLFKDACKTLFENRPDLQNFEWQQRTNEDKVFRSEHCTPKINGLYNLGNALEAAVLDVLDTFRNKDYKMMFGENITVSVDVANGIQIFE